MTDGTSVPVHERWSTRRILLVALVLTLAAVGVLGVSRLGLFAAKASAVPGSVSETGAQALASCMWTGGGRYAVIQSTDARGVPMVVVWEAASGSTRTLPGHRALAAERSSPTVWVEPVDARGPRGSEYADRLGDTWDHVPARLLVWRVDRDATPTDAAEGRWARWAGRGGREVSLEVNPVKGAAPSAIVFMAGKEPSAKAALPAGTNTFLPVGWSPSGRYFAVTTLGPAGSMDPVRLLAFDQRQGSLVGSVTIEGRHSRVAWDARSDVLMWTTGDFGGGELRWTYLHGKPKPIKPPAEWRDSQRVSLAGACRDGIVLTSFRPPLLDSWLITPKGTVSKTGQLAVVPQVVDVADDGRMLILETVAGGEGRHEIVHLVRTGKAASNKVIWRGPARKAVE